MKRLLVVLLALSSLTAGEASLTFSLAGKKDAKLAFASQAAETQANTIGATPQIIGYYLWNGRADDKYRPFFQWEFRLRGALTTIQELKIRVATLGPQRQVLFQGLWQELGVLAAKTSRDLEYRLNCTNAPACQIDLAWPGGQETYLAWGRAMVPLAMSDLADRPLLVCVNGDFEENVKLRMAAITWNLWNVGGKPVPDGAKVRVRCIDDLGQTVQETTWNQPAGKPIAAGVNLPLKLILKAAPRFSSLGFTTVLPPALMGGGLDVINLAQEGTVIKATIHNSAAVPMKGAVVILTLLGKDGAKIGELTLPAVDIEVGADLVVTATNAPQVEWTSFTSRVQPK